jgi:hypothetical protein
MRFRRVNPLCSLLAISTLLAWTSAATAVDIPFPNSPKSDAFNNLQKMKLGTINVKDKPDYPNAIADLASFMADRIVHPPFNGEEPKVKPTGTPESIDTLLDEIDRYCVVPRRTNVDETNNQVENIKVFAEKMGERIDYVMKNTRKRLEKVNAARMLVVVAKLPTDALVNPLLKMIRDPSYPDEVKLYVFQALGNVLAATDVKDPTKGVIPDMDKLAEVCKELDKIITTAYPAPKVLPDSPDYQEWAQVIQYIRREAVRALAQVKYSIVRDRQRQPVARPIWTLLRVARYDPRTETKIAPSFSASEQIEAIIGICQMRPDDLVNLDAVAYLVSDALLDLGVNHNQQRAQYISNPRFKPAIAWKLYGYRLSEALKQWKASAEKLPAKGQPVVKLVEAASIRFVTKMELEGIMAVPDAQPLVNWKSANKPKVAQVFSDDETTAFRVE